MKKINPVLLSTALWEVIRFTFLFLLIVSVSNGKPTRGELEVYWILPFGAGALILPAGLVVLMMNPEKYGGILGLLKLGKVLEVIPLLVLLGRELSTSRVLYNFRLPVYPILAAAAIDLIFLILLISFRFDENR